MEIRKRHALFGFLVFISVLAISAPTSASDDWLSFVISGVNMVLNAVPEWNKAIDKMTDQAKRDQFKRRLENLYTSFQSLELGKIELINSLLEESVNIDAIKAQLAKLRKSIDQIGKNLKDISLSLGQQTSIDGWAVENELKKDLGVKSTYLNDIKLLLRNSSGRLPEPDREMIKSQGDIALKAIEAARIAIGDSIKHLGC